jgi:hypothetical protein
MRVLVERTAGDHDRVVHAAQATQAVPKCGSVRICVEDLSYVSSSISHPNIACSINRALTVALMEGMMRYCSSQSN